MNDQARWRSDDRLPFVIGMAGWILAAIGLLTTGLLPDVPRPLGLATCIVGALLGLTGLAYTWPRRRP